ncbi:MAG: hypothetical protein ACFBSC_09680, partial [Microcoleaceae cyanobacterium]
AIRSPPRPRESQTNRSGEELDYQQRDSNVCPFSELITLNRIHPEICRSQLSLLISLEQAYLPIIDGS